jgi:hypothetical protein
MTKIDIVLLSALAAIGGIAATDYPAPNPTYNAIDFTKWSKTVQQSKKAKINVPFTAADGSTDMIDIFRLDLVGTDYERGYAHGYLMAKGNFFHLSLSIL